MAPEEKPKKSPQKSTNRNILESQWRQLKGKARQQWGRLSDDELAQISGNYEELAGLIQERYGYSRDEAYNELDMFLKDIDRRDLAGDSTTDAPPPKPKNET